MKSNTPGPAAFNFNYNTEPNRFYLDHFSKIYCTCLHLAERLSELTDSPNFADLKAPIAELVKRFTRRADNLAFIYPRVTESTDRSACAGLIAYLEEAFAPVYTNKIEHSLRNTFLLSYLYCSNNVEMASYRMLELMPANTFDARFHNLLAETFVEARMGNPMIELLLM